ncbi:hypothetical protein EN858_17380 [Mesorhizobium sp. M4B.F.Ca.ET.215.01.1.1]|uniref:hypothetical protein n=1 Tax=unclassified Mesorhizobium TaxID=325217 RepID=UPI000FCC9442|nr:MULTISPECIES: hypothetical protein [unclassified Mesorhizobium]RUW65867.1 hypothetical protein EOA31_32700 [Mesorhizobium sp. M4B.F.Ca.ET.049.02.1.2]RVC79233.1 hypothetical protein EN745_16575 [Mesorhizobium sp. M4A.F.Ca.ET.022.05.2.1]TGQ10187.1 hypothetical protein EN858_17380 [Mesorhizobium sp. M4B.F.Ca.ET.215.01.1.1]TGQ34024.1 hypothetical protein EN863_033550 [Mesorhizobium sp. M00.F.Ca.ET.220.01.1.1]TGR02726.1 hypothetical protein EN846_16830 [Mesorhizobium sp. M4B.F.Ca.ET.203.01.1.1]
MPNTTVRATAEGLPAINRRKALAFLTGGIAAAAVTASPVVANEPQASTVQNVLSACHAAENRLCICEAREASIAEALGDALFPEWKTPSGVASRWSHVPIIFRTSKALEAEIESRRELIEKSFGGGLMNRPAYERWMRDMEAQGAEGLAWLRGQEAVIDASGYHDASDQTDQAFAEARAAFQAVMELRCQTIEDVRAKAACIIRVYHRLGVEIDGDDLVACMTSLCEEA